MQNLTFDIKKVTVVSRAGTDILTLEVDAPTTFPNLGYAPFIKIELAKGYADEWCEKMGIKIDEYIKVPSSL